MNQPSSKPLTGRATLLVNLIMLATAQACASSGSGTTMPLTLSDEARRIYRDAIVIDAHNDLPSKMLDEAYDAGVRHSPGSAPDQGESDVPRLAESGLTGVFLSAWVDAPYATRTPDESWERVQLYLDAIHALARRHPNELVMATTAADVRAAKRDGKVAVLIGVEGGHAIEGSLANLREMHRRGARYMTLTWNNGTEWAGSAAGLDGTRTAGLTAFGRDVIREMNRLGMLVDVSHVSEATFHDAVATSTDPVIASHSSARALNDHVRNLTDDQLRAVARNGGVVNVNFYATFIDSSHFAARRAIYARLAEEIRAGLARPGADSAAVRAEARRRADAAVQAIPRPAMSVLLDHFDHIRRVAGIDHVGIGSDFDGVGGLLPEGMDEVTKLPLLVQGFLDRGYSEQDIRKILGGNMLRVMERVLDRR
jgi:membrane dipeptidase